MMKKSWTLLGGMGMGAAAMYLLEARRGRRHGARLTDRAAPLPDRPGHEERIAQRVRAQVAQVVSDPDSIEVEAEPGTVRLRGWVQAEEVHSLLDRVRSVPGVRNVLSELDIHRRAEARSRRPWGHGTRQRQGDRTTRLLAGAAGAALVWRGFNRRGPIGAAFRASGFGLLGRALRNRATRKPGSRRRGPGRVEIYRTIEVGAPVEQVYAWWACFESFPCFLSHIREIRDLGDGVTHWTADGPAGATVEWDAEVIQQVPNEIMAWTSLPGSPMETMGIIRFEPVGGGETRVDLEISYRVPRDGSGSGLAQLLAVDPRKQIDDDLRRMKTFIEKASPAADAPAIAGRRPAAPAGAPGTRLRDPVCGMIVEPHQVEWRMDYQGRPYAFCSEECLRAFQTEPDRYPDRRRARAANRQKWEGTDRRVAGLAAPRFGAAGSGGAEYEPLPPGVKD